MRDWPWRVSLALLVTALAAGCAQSPPQPESGYTGAAVEKDLTAPAAPVSTTGSPAPDDVAPATVAAPTPAVPETPSDAPGRAAQAVSHALATIGSPYRYGGETPAGFDCSGLVRYSFGLAGVAVPRTTAEQRRLARRLGPDEPLEAGDLVFFSRGKSGLHVGMVTGDGQFVHAATRGAGVRVEALGAPHWRRRFLEARRVDADAARLSLQ